MYVVGVDPGLSSTGVACGRYHRGQFDMVSLRLIRTKKSKSRRIRVTDDDSSRIRSIYTELSGILGTLPGPTVLGVEAYSPRPGSGSSGWKAGRVATMVEVLAWVSEVGVYVFVPQDVKRGLCGGPSASKSDVFAGVCREVPSVEAMVGEFPKTQQEHVSDAAALMILTARQVDTARRQAGLKLGV